MVYTLVGTVKNKNQTSISWYILKDQRGVQAKYKSAQIKNMIKQGNKVVGLEIKNGRLMQTKLLATKPMSEFNNTNFDYYCGDELTAFVNQGLSGINNERFIVDDIFNFCCSEIKNKICIVHGIRRTGKTVSMLQTILRLINMGVSPHNIGFIDINNDIRDIGKFIDYISDLDVQYLFIDEATFIHNFDGASSPLANRIAQNMHIVVTGTDSYMFPKAKKHALYGRAVTLHSTFISYKEQLKIFPEEGVREYLEFGGVLLKTEFAPLTNAYDTLRSVVMINIKNTLRRSKYAEDVLNSLTDDQLTYIIFNILHKTMSPKTMENDEDINKFTKPRVVGKELAIFLEEASGNNRSNWIRIDKTIHNKESYSKIMRAMYELGILSHIHNLTDANSKKVKPETSMELVCLIQSLAYSIIANISDISTVKGNAFENMIVSNIAMWGKNNPKYTVGYCRYSADGISREIDAVIKYADVDAGVNKYTLVEVKHGDSFKPDMIKNLIHPSINEALPGMHKKIVVYNGKTEAHGNIYLVNAHDFLLNIDKWLMMWP